MEILSTSSYDYPIKSFLFHFNYQKQILLGSETPLQVKFKLGCQNYDGSSFASALSNKVNYLSFWYEP